jgi:hypothetical protein
MRTIEMLMAFGRAVVKIFISAVVGVGMGLGTMGYFCMQRPDAWVNSYGHQEPPMGEAFFSIGAGLLSAAVMMLVQFYGPWAYREHVLGTTNYPDHRPVHGAG